MCNAQHRQAPTTSRSPPPHFSILRPPARPQHTSPTSIGLLTIRPLPLPSPLQALRELCKPAEEFAKKYRTGLSLFSTSNLAFIVWQTLSGARNLLFKQSASMIISVIVLAAAVHVFYLIMNHLVVK